MGKLKLRTFCLVALLVALAGCGVDWLPEYVRDPTTPDAFTFTAQNGVAIKTAVTSNAITVAGLTSASSPIKIVGPDGSNSMYSINGAAATAAAGTVQNDDKVTVTHTTSSSYGISTKSTLSIGIVTSDFTSVTQTVATPSFAVSSQGTGVVVSGVLIANDSLGGHVISITGGNVQYSISDTNGNSTSFTANSQTVSVLNGLHIFLRIPSPVSSTTTTLTIDNTNFVVSTTTPFTVTSAPK
jgi:hypothetical protein